jgi:four helix bundle protein
MTITSYRDLLVWQKGIVLATEVFKTAKALPYRDHQGIGLQLQRAAVSIPSNVAEGSARGLGRSSGLAKLGRIEASRDEQVPAYLTRSSWGISAIPDP